MSVHPLLIDVLQQGLRGIAALFVVSSHIVLCFARRIVLPCCGSTEGEPYLFQLPIFRLIAQGHTFVALFFILSGFVNALKPLKLARLNQSEVALSNLAVSSFRRTFRLMLPAAAATTISWTICQLGLYEYARNGDAYWLYTYTPGPSASWGTALDDLMSGLTNTWILGEVNVYDQPQWALIYLLQGSMMIFCALLITVNLTPTWRTICLVIFSIWSFDWSYKIRDRKNIFHGSYKQGTNSCDSVGRILRVLRRRPCRAFPYRHSRTTLEILASHRASCCRSFPSFDVISS